MKISAKIKLMLRSLLISAGSLSSDKGEIMFDGEELEVGKEVFQTVDGEVVPAENGEYVVNDITYVIEDGKVTEIRKPEEETETVEISAAKQKFNAIKAAFEDSYEDKEHKIVEAVRAFGFNDFWLVEAGDDFAIVENWNEESADYKHIRFDVSWNEEGEATVSNPTEVKSEFVPVEEEKPAEPQEFEEEPKPADEPEEKVKETKTTEEKVADLAEAVGDIREGIEQLTNAIAAVVKRLEDVEGKIAGLEAPAAEPAEEGEETEVKASRLSYLRK